MSKFTHALFASVSFVAFIPAVAYADDAIVVPPIVVSATGAPTPLDQIASSVTVITDEEIAQKNQPTIVELLREVPGLTVAANGGSGQTASVFIRGTNSSHVLVLVDGVPVNDPSGPTQAFDFSNLPMDNIERIEIMRGPQSTLYGAGAIGGVISVFTRQGLGTPRHTAFAEYGSYNTRKEGVGSSGEIGNTSYSVSLSEGHSGGISALDTRYGGSEHDGYNSYTFSGNIAQKVTENFTAKINTRYNRVDSELDGYDSFFNPADTPIPTNDVRQFNGRLAGELKVGEAWTQELGVSTLDINRFAKEVTYDHYIGAHNAIDWVHHFRIMPGNTLMAGGEAWEESFRDVGQTPYASVGNKALFADDQITVGDAFMNVGARSDWHQTFGRAVTWKVAPGYHIRSTGTTLKTTYGTGFKAPSLYQLFDPTSGNTDLQPEKSRGYDIGFEQALWGNKLMFGATWFHNDIRQIFDFAPAYPFQGINKGKARTEGVESFVSVKPIAGLTVNATHTYTLADDMLNDQQLLRRPKHQANISALWQYSEKGDVGASLRYVGNRRDYNLSFARTDLAGFTTVGLTTNYKIAPNITLYGRVDNLLDKRYEEVFGFGTPGLSVFGGVKTSF